MRNKFLLTLLAITVATGLLNLPAHAATVCDEPIKIIRIHSSQDFPGNPPDVSCTYYPDLMIYQSTEDPPLPSNALAVPYGANMSRPTCHLTPYQNAVTLQSSGSFLAGRKGNFLIFEESDGMDASTFTIFNTLNGRPLFEDSEYGPDGYRGLFGIIKAEITHGVLHLRYNRGINTRSLTSSGCSLLTDRMACWSSLIANGQIPRSAFAGPPSIDTCKKGYEFDVEGQRAPAPYDDPSVVTYTTDVTLDSHGNAKRRPAGPLQCQAAS